jgi:hypothetical protein
MSEAAHVLEGPDATAPAGGDDAASGLSARDREILDFERQWWKYAGAKEQAVRELFDLSATRYYQVLNALIDSPAALTRGPHPAQPLDEHRVVRQRGRTARRLEGL